MNILTIKRLSNSTVKQLTTLLAVLVVLSGCSEEIDIKLKSSDTRLVVEGGIGFKDELCDTCVHTVILSTTMDYFDMTVATPYVSGALVTITEFDEKMQPTGEVFLLTENPAKAGHYETTPDVSGKQGYTYRLDISNINVGGHSSYTAEAFFPYIADQIDSIQTVWGANLQYAVFGGGTDTTRRTGWNILLYADDPPTREYYAFIPYVNGVPLNDTLTRFTLLDDQIIDQQGVGLRGLPIEFISDSISSPVQVGDIIGLEIRSLSADYYRYINEFRDVYGGSNPMFGAAPANVRGNVSGGAIGYFHAYGNRKAFVVARR